MAKGSACKHFDAGRYHSMHILEHGIAITTITADPSVTEQAKHQSASPAKLLDDTESTSEQSQPRENQEMRLYE